MTSVNRFRLTLVGLACIIAAPLRAGEPAYDLDIEPQPLAKALKAFAEQSGLQVVYYSELADGEDSPEVSGTMTADQAMTQLLASTGLTFDTMGDDTVVIEVAMGAADQGGDSDLENLTPQPMLMAQNAGNQTSLDESRELGEGAKREDSAVMESNGNTDSRGQIETIVVTGTRNTGIRRYEDDAQPYVVFEAAQIENSFATNLEDLLRTRLPQNTVRAPLSLDQTQGQTRGNQSSIDLRGLGTDQTLILVNGRRLPARSDGGFSRGQPDINGIPLSAVERIEVLPTTASGIYGGGATGGVINIILKRQYTGFDINFRYDNVFDTDVAQRRIEASGGFSVENGRTNVLLTASYSDSNELLEGDRGFAQRGRDLLFRNNPDELLSLLGFPASTPNIRSLAGDLVLDDGTPLNSPITFIPIGYPGAGDDGGAALVANAGQFNLDLPNDAFGTGNSLVNNPVTSSGSLYITREFAPWLEASLDVNYFSNEGRINRGFQGTFGLIGADVPSNPFDNDIFVLVSSPDPSAVSPARSTTDTFQAIGGVDIELPGNWGAQVEYNWGSSETFSKSFVPGLMPSFRSAASSGEVDILRDLNRFPIDIEPFAFREPTTVSGPREAIARITSVRASGPFFAAPGGEILLSTSIARRIDEIRPSFAQITSGSSGRQTISFTPPSKQQVDSIYLEALIPAVSESNAKSWVRELDVQLAVRYEDYETTLPELTETIVVSSREDPPPEFGLTTTGLSSTSFTVALRYVPIDGVALRASFATGFLPPTLEQLSIPSSSIREFPSFTHERPDPKRGGVGGNNTLPIESTFGGNPNLDPEDSESYSAGIILTPRFLEGLRISADYTYIEKTGEIISPSVLDIFQFEDQLPGRVTRAPLTPEDAARGFTGGEITAFDASFLNFASSSVEAYDFQVDYLWETERSGTFNAYVIATLQTTLDSQILPSVPTIDTIGFANGPLEWRANMGLFWEQGPWSLGWSAQYYDSYKIYRADDTVEEIEMAVLDQGSSKIPSQIYHDLFANIRLDELKLFRGTAFQGLEAHIGIQNVLNEEPPIIATTAFTGGGGYSTYGDPRLRRYSIQLRKSF